MSQTIILQLDNKEINQLIAALVIQRNPEDKELIDKIVRQFEEQSNGKFFQCEACYDAENG